MRDALDVMWGAQVGNLPRPVVRPKRRWVGYLFLFWPRLHLYWGDPDSYPLGGFRLPAWYNTRRKCDNDEDEGGCGCVEWQGGGEIFCESCYRDLDPEQTWDLRSAGPREMNRSIHGLMRRIVETRSASFRP